MNFSINQQLTRKPLLALHQSVFSPLSLCTSQFLSCLIACLCVCVGTAFGSRVKASRRATPWTWAFWRYLVSSVSNSCSRIANSCEYHWCHCNIVSSQSHYSFIQLSSLFVVYRLEYLRRVCADVVKRESVRMYERSLTSGARETTAAISPETPKRKRRRTQSQRTRTISFLFF